MIARQPSALWRDTPSSLLVLTPGDDVVRLVGPGRLVWLALENPTTIADLSVALGDPDAVATFVAELRAFDLVVDAAG